MQAQQAEKKQQADGEDTESKRGRVRRLVLDPLSGEGFRFRHRTSEDKQAAELARLADALVYMSDGGLRVLRISLATKGEGSQRHFWPSFATVVGFAEAFEKRPLGELPQLLSWFASAAGREALKGQRLVVEYQFWVARKRPPISDQDKRNVLAHARDMEERVMRAQDYVDRGIEPPFGEGEWLAGYRRTRAYVEGLVSRQAKRDAT